MPCVYFQQDMKIIIQIFVSNCLLLCDVKGLIACVSTFYICADKHNKKWILKCSQNESWILLLRLGQLEHSKNKVKKLNS